MENQNPTEIQLDPKLTPHTHKILWSVIGVLLLVVVVGTYFWWQEIKKTVNSEQITDNSQLVSDNNSQASTSDWQTYTNTEYGFEFKIPKDWEELKGSGDLVNNRWISFGIFNLRTDSESAYPVRGDISFQAQGWNIQEDTLVSTGKTEQLDFNQWFEKFHKVKEYAEHDFAINNVVIKELTFYGKSAIIQDYEYIQVNEGAPPAIKELYISLGPNEVLTLSISSPMPEGRQLVAVFDQILSTFKFTK